MVSVKNTSQFRTIVHDDAGDIYRIEPNSLINVKDEIAEAIMLGWPEAKAITENGEENKSSAPWEHACGAAWEEVKKALAGKEVIKTVGADRPPIVEPSLPSDAVGEDGRVIESKTNVHACPTCEAAFNTLKGCRLHQRKVHNT